ncbi:MAG: response regulator [Candidatus Latescibacteria bacterium]|nr:response regulator [Candidatus Latescibacterota bacterium]
MAAKILIVEDESITAKYIQHLLERFGYEVPGIAASGEEALRKTEDTQPDLILMDIGLKGKMDGIATAEQIHDRFIVPFVYLTAYSDDQTLQRAKITAPFGYLLKPFQEKELEITIAMALYKYEMERKLAESEQWLATTLNSLGDAVIATDTKSRIKYINPVAEGLTGWTQAEAVGKDLTDVFQLVNTRTLARLESPVSPDLEEPVSGGLANQMLMAKDGRTTPIDARATSIKNDQGQNLGVVLVFQNITERKQAEAERAKLIFALQDALGKVKTLSGFLSICSSCKKIRDEKGFWTQIEVYLQQHSDAQFKYEVCPECAKKRRTGVLGGEV